MATRFHLGGENQQEGAQVLADPSTLSPWGGGVNSLFTRWRLPHYDIQDTDFWTKTISFAYAGNYSNLHAVYVSDPLVAQTIAGSVKGYARMSESAAAADMYPRMALRVYSGDGLTLRGTLYAETGITGLTELATSLTNRALFPNGSAALSSTSVQDGDRLVIEFGTKMNGATGGSPTYTSSYRFGDDSSTADLPENETSTSELRPWVELSQAVTFKDTSLEWRVDYENGTDWPSYEYKTAGTLSDQYSLVTSPTPRQGTKCAKYTVRPGDAYGASTGERVIGRWFESDEQHFDGGTERWYSLSIQFPSTYQSPGQWANFWEIHGDSSFTIAPMQLGAKIHQSTASTPNETLMFSMHTGQQTAGPVFEIDQEWTVYNSLSKGLWNDLIWWVRFNQTATGAVKIWQRIEGEDVFTRRLYLSSIPTLVWQSGIGMAEVFTIAGFYRNTEASLTNTIYMDNVRRGTSLASVVADFNPNYVLQDDDSIGITSVAAEARAANDYNFGAFRDRGQRTGASAYRFSSLER